MIEESMPNDERPERLVPKVRPTGQDYDEVRDSQGHLLARIAVWRDAPKLAGRGDGITGLNGTPTNRDDRRAIRPR